MKNQLLYALVLFVISCKNINQEKDTIKLQKPIIENEFKEEDKVENKTKEEDTLLGSIKKESHEYIFNSEISFENNELTEIGIINDSDGYSNLREEKTSKSKILKRINKSEYFFYQPDSISNWIKVKDLYGYVGFLHKSRVIKVTDSDLYSLSFYNYDKTSDTDIKKDTIVKTNDLESHFENFYLFSDFNYRKMIPQNSDISYKDTIVTYLDTVTKMSLKIVKSRFEPSQHEITYQENYVSQIDGLDFFGADGGLPRFKLDNIIVKSKDIAYQIPNTAFKNLFEPSVTPRRVEISKPNDDRLIIQMHNSDGAGAYSVVFILKGQKLIKRIVYINF